MHNSRIAGCTVHVNFKYNLNKRGEFVIKKKLLIMMNSMGFGGVEKALLDLLKVLDKNKLDVTVLFVTKSGEYLDEIPSWVNVEEIKLSPTVRSILEKGKKATILETIKKYNFLSTIKVILLLLKGKVFSIILKNKNGSLEALGQNTLVNENYYDAALDFHGYASFTTYYVSEKVNANIKATWIHSSDFFNNVKNLNYYYNKYDQVYGVSQTCVEGFIEALPEFKERCDTFYNIILTDDIIMRAEHGTGFEDNFKGIRILSVGRLSVQKGYDVAINIASKLNKDRYDFRWYVIGEGSERSKLEKLIKDYHIEDRFVLLGASDNPYPFMKQCDIYVQPSRWEGYCTTTNEARILCKPVVTTNVSGAHEQFINDETGMIVDFDEDKIYCAIKKLITDKQLRNKFKENLTKKKVDTSSEMEKLYALIDK